jgi:hypothetical protein
MKQTQDKIDYIYPDMIIALKSVQKIANDTMPSSIYLRHDSNRYNQDKVDLYELCKAVLEKCNNILNRG